MLQRKWMERHRQKLINKILIYQTNVRTTKFTKNYNSLTQKITAIMLWNCVNTRLILNHVKANWVELTGCMHRLYLFDTLTPFMPGGEKGVMWPNFPLHISSSLVKIWLHTDFFCSPERRHIKAHILYWTVTKSYLLCTIHLSIINASLMICSLCAPNVWQIMWWVLSSIHFFTGDYKSTIFHSFHYRNNHCQYAFCHLFLNLNVLWDSHSFS